MQVPEKNGAFSLLGICNPESRHHGLPRTGAAEIGKRGGLEEAVVEDLGYTMYSTRRKGERGFTVIGRIFVDHHHRCERGSVVGDILVTRWSLWRSCFISPFFVLVSLKKKNGGT